MKPAGLENAQGIITAAYIMEATDKQWDVHPEMKAWNAWMDKWMPGANKADANHVYGFAVASLMHETLKKCGDELTRDNVMKQAANLKDVEIGVLLPGIKLNSGPNDFYPIEQMQMQKFNGTSWELFGPVMSGETEPGF